jgi:hypothetical protein
MTRFQLVFRENGVDRIETRDNNVDGEPQIDGKLIVDGEVYVIKGVEWLLTADHIGDSKRFLCTLVAQPADD